MSTSNFVSVVDLGAFAYLGRDILSTKEVNKKYFKKRFYLSLEVGENCQLSCKHCKYGERVLSKKPKPKFSEQVGKELSAGLSFKHVSFAGKEPTFYSKDLLKIATILKSAGNTNTLMTNGLLLGGHKLVIRLAKQIDYFDVSLDGTKMAHDWMRGDGTFDKTLVGIETTLSQTDAEVGVIATVVNAKVDNSPQYENIITLADVLREKFGKYNNRKQRVPLSISLYYGKPGDPMLLNTGIIVKLIQGLQKMEFLTRILFIANYAYMFPSIARNLGIQNRELVYDSQTGIPLMRLTNNTDLVLFNLVKTAQYVIRVANNGSVYLGCNHLTLRLPEKHAIGSLESESLLDIVERVRLGECELIKNLESISTKCNKCKGLSLCGGADNLSALYYETEDIDCFYFEQWWQVVVIAGCYYSRLFYVSLKLKSGQKETNNPFFLKR